MQHEFVENKNIDTSKFDNITKVEVCKYCDVQRWTWIGIKYKKIKEFQYMLNKDTQYWNPNEECSDKYKLRQLKLF